MSKSLIYSFAAAAFAAIVLAPAFILFATAVWKDGSPTLEYIKNILNESRHWNLLLNTAWIGGASAALATILGAALGYVVSRADLPGRSFIRAIWLGPLLMPPLIQAIAWTELAPIRGATAAIIIFAFNYYPIVAILTAGALDRVDGRALDAATLAGGPRLRRKLEFRYLLPPALVGGCAAFIFIISDFSVPDYLSSIGTKINVYADEIFSRWQRAGDAGSAVAASIPTIALGLGMLMFSARLRKRGLYTIGGTHTPASKGTLGPWRFPILILILVLLSVSLFVPLGLLLKTAGSPATLLDSLFTARRDILQTLLTASCAAAAATILAFTAARAVLYISPGKRATVESLSALTFAIPSMALAIAMIRIWNHPGPAEIVYNSCGVVILTMVARFYIFPFAACAGGLNAIDRSIEESAMLAGMGFPRRLFVFLGGLASPALLGAFLITFVLAMRELDAIVLIPSGNQSTMFRVYNAIHFNRKEFVAGLCVSHAFLTMVPVALAVLLFQRKPEIRL